MDAGTATAAQALRFVFGDGEAVDDEEGVARLADRLGAPRETLALASSDAVKSRLREATEEAIAAGVFGVPTFVVDGQLFWGQDSEGMLCSYLDAPERFGAGEAARIEMLPESRTRRR